MNDHSGRVRAAMHLLIISLLSAQTGRAVTLASTSFEGTGLTYTLTGEFDTSGGTTTTDYFKVIPNNGTRVETGAIPPSGVFGSGDGANVLVGTRTTAGAVGVTFASVNIANHNNVALQVLLAASNGTGGRGFESGDYLLVQANVDGAGFQEIAEFRPQPDTPTINTHLSRETTGDTIGDFTSTTDANSVETNFKTFTFPVPNGSSVVLRMELRGNATGEYIAIDNVRLTGDPVANPPVLSGLNSATQPYAEGQGALTIGGGITVTDPDSANLVSGTVTISANFAAGQDVLSVAPSGGITATFDANTGVLTLAGSATLADYQATLRTLAYTNTDNRHPAEAVRTINLLVNDGASASNQGTLQVQPTDTLPRLRIPFCETFSTDGRGTRFQATNFFDAGADDAFTRVKLPRASSSLTGTGGNDPYAWYGEDTDGQSATPTTLVFDLDTAGYSGVTLTLDLAAAPNAFEPPDEIKVEQSVAGGAFALVGAFRPTSTTVFNVNLARDADLDGVGEGAALGNAFTRHTVALASGSDCKVRITVMANATSDEIAIGDVCVTGTPAVAAPQPLLYYNFEEGSGTVPQNRGTLGGTGTLLGTGGNERWVPGAPGGATPGKALEFDGNDLPAGDGVQTGFTATQLGIANSDSYTAAAWINFTREAGDTMVFSQNNQTDLILHDGVRDSHAHLGHWGNDVTGASVLQTGVWYHVVWLYDQGRQSIFVNGNRDVGPLPRGMLANVGNIIIGNAGPAGWGFQGTLDEVVIFDEALNYGQILALANGGDPAALPPASPQTAGAFFTAPFGPGGTWNLYEVVGVNNGEPQTWYNAEVAASTKPNPFGTGVVAGHLPTLESREEQYTLSYMAGMRALWIGLTDDHTVFGGTEAGTDPNIGWVWTSRLTSTYRSWAGGEPNNLGDEDSTILNGDGSWNDSWTGIPEAPASPGQVLLAYVIEWNLASATAVPGAIVVGPVLPPDLAGPTGATDQFGVLAVKDNGALTHIRAGVDSVQSGTGTRLTGTAPAINHVDPEGANRGTFIDDLPILANTAAVDENNVHVYKGLIHVQTADTYTFAVNADDSFALRLRGASWSGVNGGFAMIDHLSSGDTMFVDQFAYFATAFGRVNLAAGFYELDFVAHQDRGGSGHEVLVARGNFSSLADTPDWRMVGHVSAGTIGRPGVQVSGFTVTTSAPNGPVVNNLLDAQVQIGATGTTSTQPVINFADPDNPGGGGSFSPNTPFPRGTAGVEENDFAVQVDAVITIPVEGDYIFGYRSDDGASLQIVGQSWLGIVDTVDGVSVIAGDTVKYDQITGDSFTRAKIHLAAGTYSLRGLYWERGGGAHYELFGDTALNGQTRLLTAGAAASYQDPDGLRLIAPPLLHATVYNPDHTYDLVWDSSPGLNYRVEYAFDLPNWNLHPTSFPASGGSTTTVRFGALSGFERIYMRVRTQ